MAAFTADSISLDVHFPIRGSVAGTTDDQARHLQRLKLLVECGQSFVRRRAKPTRRSRRHSNAADRHHSRQANHTAERVWPGEAGTFTAIG